VRKLDPDQEAGNLIQKNLRRLATRKRPSRANSRTSRIDRHQVHEPQRRPGGRLPWWRWEASRCVQRAVAISTIALVVLVVLLIILECAVFRKKPENHRPLDGVPVLPAEQKYIKQIPPSASSNSEFRQTLSTSPVIKSSLCRRRCVETATK
jgi:hypothetical protein